MAQINENKRQIFFNKRYYFNCQFRILSLNERWFQIILEANHRGVLPGFKMSDLFTPNWRQVRVFTSLFSDQWYFDLLNSVVRPFSVRFPGVPFWFSRYGGIRGAPDEDVADTEIERLPPAFISPEMKCHFSLRFRFPLIQGEEAFLRDKAFIPRFWFSEFLDFNVLDEFGGERFCSSTDIDDRLRRTDILIHLFHHNCLLVLDSIKLEQGVWMFEDNSHNQNTSYHSSFVSVAHICANIFGQRNGDRLPFCVIKDQTCWHI
jgi:hypothetical protein